MPNKPIPLVYDPLITKVCRDFMNPKGCTRDNCKFIHDKKLCARYWKNGSCKFNEYCRRNHFVTDPNKIVNLPKNKPKNTECYEPITKPVDARIVYDLNTDHFQTPVTSRDIVIVPNVFTDFSKGELYTKLLSEIQSCSVPQDKLLILWHGSEERNIPGCHYICNDKTGWKKESSTFNMVLERIEKYFKFNIQATRLNWYKDTSQWKRFHHDSAYVNPERAKKQNFTIAVSFGATRDAAFEHAATKTVISLPQPDGHIYCFANDTNAIWRHGILQDMPARDEGRISIIAWGKLDSL